MAVVLRNGEEESDTQTHWAEGHVPMEAEIGVMCPQTKEPPDVRKRQGRILP